MSGTVLYGLAHCDSCKQARAWLESQGIEYDFHDLKKSGLEPKLLDQWIDSVGVDVLLNRRGTTWRKLPESDKGEMDTVKARKLMLAHTSLIKRPVLQVGAAVVVGFSSAQYDVVFEGAD